MHWVGGGCQSGQLVIEEAGGRWRQDYLMIGLDPNLLLPRRRRRSSWPELNFYLHLQGQLRTSVVMFWVKQNSEVMTKIYVFAKIESISPLNVDMKSICFQSACHCNALAECYGNNLLN